MMHNTLLMWTCSFIITLGMVGSGVAAEPDHAAPGVTSLTNKTVKYQVSKTGYALLKRAEIRAVIVDNSAVDNELLPGHRAGYNGVASLTHTKQPVNLFVPSYAGLNYEHIHDGTLTVAKEKFEPRKAAMELRIIDEHTVELYQPPTHNWKLESCGRYALLEDGTIEYTFECIPRAATFQDGTLALFWASYIHDPGDKSIQFSGRKVQGKTKTDWLKLLSPRHGVDATHPPAGVQFRPKVDPEFPLTLVNHPSKYVYTAPWYFGVSGKMAFVQMFRKKDQIWFAQSPTGGGATNPAWDFQWFVPKVQVGRAYGFVMRAKLLPYQNREQVSKTIQPLLKELNSK